jgi:ligand-binding SRPBCC domain-containing protein
MPIPKVALDFILGEKASILTASQQVLPKKLESWGFTFKYAELQKALQSELAEISQGDELFVKRQYIDRPIAEVFAFFAEAKNLEKITPAFLNFKIISVSTENIEQGTLIEYSLKVHGVPIKWKTQIESWRPPYEFVDNQLSGPYALWQHTHSFMTLGSGTLITDRVRYRLPLGYLGWLTSAWVVQKDIETIFAFRSRMIADNKIVFIP